MSQEVFSEPQVEPAKPRKTMKIIDVKGRLQYGNSFNLGRAGVDVRMTHPTKEDIQKALDDGYLIDRPFSGNQQALFDEWIEEAGGSCNRAKFIEIATRWHAGRIAYLSQQADLEPIGIRPDDTIHDGQHRLIAMEFRGDTEVEAIIG